MCRTYTVGQKKPERRLHEWESAPPPELVEALNEQIHLLPGTLIRPTLQGVVVRRGGNGTGTGTGTGTGNGYEVTTMRWGFLRPQFSREPIVNARTDKLGRPTWKKPWAERRCVIPVSAFYEWQENPPGVSGPKQSYRFEREDGDWMWMAGLWEEDPTVGLVYSMVTTDPPPLMQPIHDRMPAVIDWSEADAFLDGNPTPPPPYPGSLLARPCDSPLRRKPAAAAKAAPPPEPMPPREEQGELF